MWKCQHHFPPSQVHAWLKIPLKSAARKWCPNSISAAAPFYGKAKSFYHTNRCCTVVHHLRSSRSTLDMLLLDDSAQVYSSTSLHHIQLARNEKNDPPKHLLVLFKCRSSVWTILLPCECMETRQQYTGLQASCKIWSALQCPFSLFLSFSGDSGSYQFYYAMDPNGTSSLCFCCQAPQLFSFFYCVALDEYFWVIWATLGNLNFSVLHRSQGSQRSCSTSSLRYLLGATPLIKISSSVRL